MLGYEISKNIIYSMGFRLQRICSDENIFEKRLAELKTNFLIPRNYIPKIIDSEFQKVKELPGANFTEKGKFALEKKKASTSLLEFVKCFMIKRSISQAFLFLLVTSWTIIL